MVLRDYEERDLLAAVRRGTGRRPFSRLRLALLRLLDILGL